MDHPHKLVPLAPLQFQYRLTLRAQELELRVKMTLLVE